MLPDAKVYTIEDLARRWNVNTETVRRLIASGEIGHFKVGVKLIRVSQAHLDEYESREAKEARHEQ